MNDFVKRYPYVSRDAALAAISEQGLVDYAPYGGRSNGVDRYAIRHTPHDHTPVAERAGRVSGAKAICAEVFEQHNTDKRAFVVECEKRGVFGGTAKARWTDLVRMK